MVLIKMSHTQGRCVEHEESGTCHHLTQKRVLTAVFLNQTVPPVEKTLLYTSMIS